MVHKSNTSQVGNVVVDVMDACMITYLCLIGERAVPCMMSHAHDVDDVVEVVRASRCCACVNISSGLLLIRVSSHPARRPAASRLC